MKQTESQAIEASEARENDRFQRASKNNTVNPFAPDVPVEDIMDLLHSNPWEVDSH